MNCRFYNVSRREIFTREICLVLGACPRRASQTTRTWPVFVSHIPFAPRFQKGPRRAQKPGGPSVVIADDLGLLAESTSGRMVPFHVRLLGH